MAQFYQLHVQVHTYMQGQFPTQASSKSFSYPPKMSSSGSEGGDSPSPQKKKNAQRIGVCDWLIKEGQLLGIPPK